MHNREQRGMYLLQKPKGKRHIYRKIQRVKVGCSGNNKDFDKILLSLLADCGRNVCAKETHLQLESPKLEIYCCK